MNEFVKPNIDRTFYLFSDKAKRINRDNPQVVDMTQVVDMNEVQRIRTYSWDIPDCTLNNWGKLSLVSRTYRVVQFTTTPITTRILNIGCKDTIDTSGGFGEILDISAWNYLAPFVPPPPINVSPQTINNITLAIDDDMAVNGGGIYYKFIFCIVLKLTEGDPERVEFGSTNNLNVNQRQIPYY